ncbi:MAG TPA: aspartyl-phosphate phosphatase Spo0E family protein [Desulfosporosinus sp.]|nr:aspartyl-phosphate phosphatase Spo0E family protein [Desulfosporosinus sp.]
MKLTHQRIEALRLLMHDVAWGKDLTDQRVVSMSRKLDVLINEYYAMDESTLKPAM